MSFRNLWYKLSCRGRQSLGWTKPRKIHSAASIGIDLDQLNPNAKQIVNRLMQAGYESYLVGGCVRDFLCQQVPKDYDIVTEARPECIKKLFRRSRIIGKRFKLVHVLMGDEVIEVNTFRGQAMWWDQVISMLPGKKRHSNNIYGDLDQDVWRRDFTANALYLSLKDQTVIDYVDGVEAIQNKHLALIGNHKQRLCEDPVRILRALRFKAKTGFSWSDQLESDLRSHSVLLKSQSRERLFLELVKFFSEGHAQSSLTCLINYQIFPLLVDGFPSQLNKKSSVLLKLLVKSADRSARSGRSFNQILFFATLFWPFLELFLQKKPRQKKESSITQEEHRYNHQCRQCMREICAGIGLPKRLQDAIMVIWRWQFYFQYKPSVDLSALHKGDLFVKSFKLLKIRANVEESLVESALQWAEKTR